MIKILVILPGILLYLYNFWKRLKDDYTRNQIFSTAFYGLALLVVGYMFSIYFFQSFMFWFTLMGAVVGFIIGIFRYKLKILEVLEAAVLGLISLYAFILLAELIVTNEIFYLFSFVVMILLVLLFFLLDRYYKGFAWYKSGRIGFSGLTVSGVFFMIYAVIAITLGSMISFVSNKDALIASFFALTSFMVVLRLARQKT